MGVSPFLAEIGKEFRWARLLPSLTMGLIIGLVELMLAISFAALIFNGPLSPFLPNGIGFALVGAIITGTAVALLTSAPGAIGGNQDAPAAIIAVASVAIAGAMPPAAGERELYVTVVVTIGIATALTGLFFYGLAHYGLGNLVRFLPYPVVGGFLAGTGWLLVMGAISVMVDVTPSLDQLPLLLQPEQLMRWLPGVLLAVVFVLILKRIDHVLAVPAIVMGAVAIFYAVAALGGQSVAALSANGWLLGPFPDENLWQPLAMADLALVHWPAVLGQAVNIGTVMLMSTVALLLNASGLELARGMDVSLNRELRAAGIGNLLGGGVGGLVGFQQLSLSVMNENVGSGSRLAGLFAGALGALVLLAGASTLSMFPKVVLGGLLFFLGLSFLLEWLVETWSTLPRMDYAVILLIVVVTAAIGFMEAVGVGLLVAVILFVIKYSRTEVIRDELTCRQLQSRVTRSPGARRIIEAAGDHLSILRLQGFVFFGTAAQLVTRVRRRMEDPNQPALRFLLLDFRHVTGSDSTALLYFAKMAQLAERHHITLVLTEPSPAMQRQLDAGIAKNDTIRVFPDLDRGLEWCEEQLLATTVRPGRVQDGLQHEIGRTLASEETAASLLAYFERQELEKGHTLMRQGDAPDALYFVESGQMTAYLEQDGGKVVRLQTMRGWNVLGEIGFFLDNERTATVVTDAPAVVYHLSREALAMMCDKDPEAATALHQVIVRLLAARVVHLVGAVDALRR